MALATETAFSIAEQGVTLKTREAYVRAYKAFVEYIRQLDEVPTQWETCIMLFRGHLISQGKSSRTVASYITGVRNRLKLDGVELNENMYIMKLMHRAAQKQDVERLRYPITKGLLIQILKRVDLVARTYFEATLWGALFTLAYHGMFRIGELIESEHALKTCNLLQEDDMKTLHCIQHSSKVLKPGMRPHVVLIHPTGELFCPCKMVNLYSLERAEAQRYWCSIPSHFFVAQNGKRIAKQQVLRVVRKCIALIPGFLSGRIWDP